MNDRTRLAPEIDPEVTVLAKDGPTEPKSKAVSATQYCGREMSFLSEDREELIRQKLRQRLRAATLVIAGCLLIYLGWVSLYARDDYLQKPELIVTNIFAVAVLLICARITWAPQHLCIYTLRTIEMIVFGMPAIYMMMMTCVEMQHFTIVVKELGKARTEIHGKVEHWVKNTITSDQHVELDNAKKSISESINKFIPPDPTGQWIILIFIYSLFIPNHQWKRILIFNGTLLLLAVASMVIGIYVYDDTPNCYDFVHLFPMLLKLLIACASGTYGAHLIGSLQNDMIKARQMGNYRLREKIATGGMGNVYKAEHDKLKRECAIKVIKADLENDPKSKERFMREVDTMAKLTHWNTVEIFDYGETNDGQLYYVMEFLPGLSLHDLVDKHGPLSAERTIFFLRQICDALDEAHHMHILHRDIKPSNIFAAERGGRYDVAKLLDFGLVKPLDDKDINSRLTQDGMVAGTPQYMSPEQATGQPLDSRSDIYSLGALAYFLVTGRPPFESDNPVEVLIAHARDTVIPPSSLRPGLPMDLEQVILKCLEKNPDDRYPDVRSLEEALANCRAANRWSYRLAEVWWRDNEPTTFHDRQVVATLPETTPAPRATVGVG